ncbi:hypothetical protein G7Y89_g14235 [Cudoniella acicularis]|uniref:Uncharacterized protein n=1 Tax=Cudoniella acicularis TaxID=354080 RepID=A0A8H4R3K3_9HELO|nr:hypothetical protein G7Y89_g14235 [Cudoniella acicularis]
MSKSITYKHYLRALSRWPKDPLRPDCQFQDIMQKRIDRKFLPSKPKEGEDKPLVAPSAINEKAELEQVNALYSLLGNRYTQKYTLSKEFMKPASNPEHYTNLIKELEEAPTRSWWGNVLNRWKGAVRF